MLYVEYQYPLDRSLVGPRAILDAVAKTNILLHLDSNFGSPVHSGLSVTTVFLSKRNSIVP
jgi:hypothetical protein